MPVIITWLLGPIGRWVFIGGVVISMVGSVYVKGRIDGKRSYQAQLERQVNKAIIKGNNAEAEALKKFDEQKEITDDEFERKN